MQESSVFLIKSLLLLVEDIEQANGMCHYYFERFGRPHTAAVPAFGNIRHSTYMCTTTYAIEGASESLRNCITVDGVAQSYSWVL